MSAHVSIAFFGNFRPIHCEAETLDEAVKSMRSRITGEPLETLETMWRDFKRQRKAGISIESSCHELSDYSVALRDYKRNPWLDSVTESFPVSPLERGEA